MWEVQFRQCATLDEPCLKKKQPKYSIVHLIQIYKSTEKIGIKGNFELWWYPHNYIDFQSHER